MPAEHENLTAADFKVDIFQGQDLRAVCPLVGKAEMLNLNQLFCVLATALRPFRGDKFTSPQSFGEKCAAVLLGQDRSIAVSEQFIGEKPMQHA